MSAWQLQQAKARLSELLKLAQQRGPQEITVHGRLVAVVLSRADYERLAGGAPSLLELMRSSPLHDLDDVQFERDRSVTRDVAL